MTREEDLCRRLCSYLGAEVHHDPPPSTNSNSRWFASESETRMTEEQILSKIVSKPAENGYKVIREPNPRRMSARDSYMFTIYGPSRYPSGSLNFRPKITSLRDSYTFLYGDSLVSPIFGLCRLRPEYFPGVSGWMSRLAGCACPEELELKMSALGICV